MWAVTATKPRCFAWLASLNKLSLGSTTSRRSAAKDRLNHHHAENLVRLHPEQKNRMGGQPIVWKSERQIRKEQPKDSHSADGVAISQDGSEVAIEMELIQKNTADIDNILEQLSYRYEHIVHFSHPRVYNFVNQRLRQLNPIDKANLSKCVIMACSLPVSITITQARSLLEAQAPPK